MSWGFFDGLAKQVTKYSSAVGQAWYILTFIFRLIIVASLGSAVYGDEQGNFKCNDVSAGCNNVCYNQFTTISHLKFWAFQMMAVTAPVVMFHFFATYLTGEWQKIKETKAALESNDDGAFRDECHRQYEASKMRHRLKIVGQVKTKRVFSSGKLEEIPINNKIRLAYFISTLMRLIAEGIFLYLTYTLYNYQTPKPDCKFDYVFAHADVHQCFINGTGLDFLWAEFPEFYRCAKQPGATIATSGVQIACFQNLAFGGYVPCWTSRAWEKTVFLRYMNVTSAICFCLCAIEIFVIPLQYLKHQSSKEKVRLVYDRENPLVKDLSVEMPPPRPIYSSHAHADYPSRPQSYYDDKNNMSLQRPQHPPPNENSTKKYEEFKA